MSTNTTVTKTILLNTTAAKVWEALTNPVLMKRWMSEEEIEIDSNWEVGGPMIVRGKVNGKYEYKGTILQIEPGKMLRYNSWNKISRLPDRPENYSVVEFQLVSTENQTSLTLTHSNLIAEAAYEHSNFYWGSALYAIKMLVEK